ncbi:MAG: lytic transglycosylase domain-containing protein [Acutalibacteraceae bacterium]
MNGNKNNKLKLSLYLLLTTVILVIIIYSSVSLAFQALYPKQYSEYVTETCKTLNLEEPLLYALINTESGFDKDAVSAVGAKGLTQITDDTFLWLQTKTKEERPIEDLFEPEVSIYYGGYFLDMLLDEFENTEAALAAYHAGRGRVNEWLADPRYSKDGKTLDDIPFADTKLYVEKVMKNYKRYIKIYDFEIREETENVNI